MRLRIITKLGALVAAVVTLLTLLVRAWFFDVGTATPWWTFPVFFGVWIAFVAVFVLVYVKEHFAGETFFCEDCGTEFRPSTAKLAASFRAGDKWRIKCPGCGERTVCRIKEDDAKG